ncbi:MAG: hypothetical protein V4532_00635, partial [Pseudomonadota bacterium]
WIGLVWTALVVTVAAWLITEHLQDHRAVLLQTSEHRLHSLTDTLDVTFEQLDALPRALSRQNSIQEFLKRSHVPNSAELTEADRQHTQAALRQQPDVIKISAVLRETTHDFHLNDIFLLDRFGTVVADSRLAQSVNVLGANFKTRTYFTEALDGGSGSQFAVGRITKIPGFYFATRVSADNELLGVVAVKQEPAALSRLMDDPQRRLLVTDPQGVILMSNQSSDLLGRSPLQGPIRMEPEQAKRLYMRTLQDLPWTLGQVHVRGQTVMQVRIGGQLFMAQSQPMAYGQLTAWTLA